MKPAKMTTAQICAAAGVSPRLYAMVKKVHRLACPDLWGKLVDGTLSAHLALQICSVDHGAQRLILSAMAGMTARERTGFVQRVLALAKARGEVA